jgi:hypothetical protein
MLVSNKNEILSIFLQSWLMLSQHLSGKHNSVHEPALQLFLAELEAGENS